MEFFWKGFGGVWLNIFCTTRNKILSFLVSFFTISAESGKLFICILLDKVNNLFVFKNSMQWFMISKLH